MPCTINRLPLLQTTEPQWKVALWEAARAQRRLDLIRESDARSTPQEPEISPQRQQLASANIKFLSGIIQQLVALREEEETDEYGSLRANAESFDAACDLLTDAALELVPLNRQIPYGCASTDSEGGIRIEWVRQNVSVHLVVPPNRNRTPYIYHEVGERYGTTAATPEKLAACLGDLS
jgi:hypothetical protein